MSERHFYIKHMGRGLSEYSVSLDADLIISCTVDANDSNKESYIVDAALPDKEYFGKWLDVHLLLEEFLSQDQ